MDEPVPLAQFLERLPQEVEDPAADKFDAPGRSHGVHHARNAVDRQLKAELVCAEGLFCGSTLGQLFRQSFVGDDQSTRSAGHCVQHTSDRFWRLAIGPQGRLGDQTRQISHAVA